MSNAVSLDELLAAYDWVSASESAALGGEAYVGRSTGTVYWCGEGVDDEPAEDIEDACLYIAVPHKCELDLGRALAMRFIEERLPRERETVNEYFQKRGAYTKYKALLEHAGQLNAWYLYEQDATETALREWCSENGFTVVP